ncbi:Type IV inositol polyphosphate 5-phosphatase 9 [Linum perenne]
MLRLGSNTNNFVADFPSSVTTSPPPPPELLPAAGDHDDHPQQEVYKLLVGSWNVGGNSPPADLDIGDWLNDGDISLSPDIYVLGFQEVVPLNAGNIIRGSSDNNINGNNNISLRWNSTIGEALNRSYNMSNYNDKENEVNNMVNDDEVRSKGDQYGCLGSVSVRFFVEKTSFCFVCSHLASGGKEGDERYRNADAGEIMSRTNFRRPRTGGNLPRKILHHEIYLPETTTRFLVQKGDWNVLLKKDQLKAELRKGRVFDGWNEGSIQFAPTYKYCPNSGVYYGFDSFSQHCRPKPSKGRAPAW